MASDTASRDDEEWVDSRPVGFGDFGKLPIELRTQIWFALEKLHGSTSDVCQILRNVSTSISDEFEVVFWRSRIITLDFSSYESREGRWPSEFPIHDQYHNRWRVSPQFDRRCCTFEHGKDIGILERLDLHMGVHVRIVLAAPKDEGELLQTANRMKWASFFLTKNNATIARLEMLETTERSWRDSLPPEQTKDYDAMLGQLSQFVLGPLEKWRGDLSIQVIGSNGRLETARLERQLQSLFEEMKRTKKSERKLKEEPSCHRILGHFLDKVKHKSGDMLRLEQLATIDARWDSEHPCKACRDRRVAASAWAPQKRDRMLRLIHQEMARRLGPDMAEDDAPHGPRSDAGSTTAMREEPYPTQSEQNEQSDIGEEENVAELGPSYGRYHIIERIRTQFLVDGNNHENEEVAAAFQKMSSKVDRNKPHWPDEVLDLENFWKSLHHWRDEYPNGIPYRDSPLQRKVLNGFKERHVMHPPELCGCKGPGWGGGWAGCRWTGTCSDTYLDYGYDSDTDDETRPGGLLNGG